MTTHYPSTADTSWRPGIESSISWLLSAIMHMLLFLGAALAWHPPPQGAAVEVNRQGGIVLVDLSDSQPRYTPAADEEATAGPLTAESFSVGGSPGSGADSGLPGPEAAPVNASRVLPRNDSLPGGAAPGGRGLPAATDLLGGIPAGGGGARPPGAALGKATQTYVFGVPGSGHKFIYVFDRSASMSGFGGRPFSAARRELVKSLRSLESTHQFQIIFYNHRTIVYNPLYPQPPKMLFGEDENKRGVERWVSSLIADGGTDHMQALRLALGLGPDVVFFLTDADDPQLSDAELARVTRLNHGSVINAIEFGAGPSSGRLNFLMKLARQNRGQHAYVDITQLPAADE